MIGTFSSCLLYTCETAYYNMAAAVKREHHLPGQCSLSAHWTAHTRGPALSTRGWAGESSRQWISSKATFDCSSSSQVWVCKRLTLASVVQHLRLSRRNRPAQFFAATMQNFSYKQVCSPHTLRVQAQGEQLHQAHLVIPWTVIYPHICASDSILLLWLVTTTTYCVALYRRFAVFLCVPPHNRRFCRIQWVVDECGRWSKIVAFMFWCECIIVGYAFWICVDVACAIHITIVTHKPTSKQIHHHCHTVLPALTLLAILPLQLHCSHTHTQEHGTLTHPRNELGIRKSWGGLAAIQTNYAILLWRWGHHRSRQNSSKNPQGDRKRGPEAP